VKQLGFSYEFLDTGVNFSLIVFIHIHIHIVIHNWHCITISIY